MSYASKNVYIAGKTSEVLRGDDSRTNRCYDRRKTLCLRFAQKAAKHEKMKKMFPLKRKIFNMTTRHEEKYQVQHANTDRLRKSPIIYMQNLLNLQKS